MSESSMAIKNERAALPFEDEIRLAVQKVRDGIVAEGKVNYPWPRGDLIVMILGELGRDLANVGGENATLARAVEQFLGERPEKPYTPDTLPASIRTLFLAIEAVLDELRVEGLLAPGVHPMPGQSPEKYWNIMIAFTTRGFVAPFVKPRPRPHVMVEITNERRGTKGTKHLVRIDHKEVLLSVGHFEVVRIMAMEHDSRPGGVARLPEDKDTRHAFQSRLGELRGLKKLAKPVAAVLSSLPAPLFDPDLPRFNLALRVSVVLPS